MAGDRHSVNTDSEPRIVTSRRGFLSYGKDCKQSSNDKVVNIPLRLVLWPPLLLAAAMPPTFVL